MNTTVTSKEAILQICKEIVSEDGLSSLNMRRVAQKCKVALGSLYNYFPSKNDLITCTIESVWNDILHIEYSCENESSFSYYVQRIFESVKAGISEYPNFFTAHSIGFASEDKGQARQTMKHYFLHMKSGLLETLKHDLAVREKAFDEGFTPTDFVDFVLSSLVSLLVQDKNSCTVLLEIIRRTLY